MKIILLRHTESIKNIYNSFSSFDNTEVLTNAGLKQAEVIAEAIYTYAKTNNFLVDNIYTADSERAKATGSFIAKKFQVGISSFPELISVTTNESLNGRTEQEVQQTNPVFIKELNLYRVGIFNAYNYTTVGDSIKSGKYEKMIINTLNSIISNKNETLKIIVLHYSSLTASIIHFARIGYNYPKTFYGKIESNLGNIFLIDITDDKCHIELADSAPNFLLKIKY